VEEGIHRRARRIKRSKCLVPRSLRGGGRKGPSLCAQAERSKCLAPRSLPGGEREGPPPRAQAERSKCLASRSLHEGCKKDQSVSNLHSSLGLCYGPAFRRPVTVGSFADAYPLSCLNLPSSPFFAAATYFVPPGSSLNYVTPDLNGFACISPPDDARTTIDFAEPSTR